MNVELQRPILTVEDAVVAVRIDLRTLIDKVRHISPRVSLHTLRVIDEPGWDVPAAAGRPTLVCLAPGPISDLDVVVISVPGIDSTKTMEWGPRMFAFRHVQGASGNAGVAFPSNLVVLRIVRAVADLNHKYSRDTHK
jgi:hypothetical protein